MSISRNAELSHLHPSAHFCSVPSVPQLTDMNEREEVLLEQFLTLPQLKQILSDKDDLVKSIEELASMSSLIS